MTNIEFEITSVTDKAVGLKLPVVEMEDVLNEKLKLDKYGIDIQKIFFVYIAVPPTNKVHENQITYTESKQHIEIALKLDYEKVLSSSPEDCRQLMHALFLSGLELCNESDIAKFNWPLMQKDIENLFDIHK